MTALTSALPRRGTSDRRLVIAIAVVCVIGLGIAGYLTYVHYEKLKVLCLSSGGCETVQSSRYAKLDGIPVPVLGLVGYFGVLLSLAIRGEWGRLTSFGLALIGFAFSMYLTYRELFTIKAICQWCVGSAVLMTVLAILTTIRVLRDDGTDFVLGGGASATDDGEPDDNGGAPGQVGAAADGARPARDLSRSR